MVILEQMKNMENMENGRMMDNEAVKTILFVDDEESILDVASEHFQKLGYHVLTARNGKDAVKKIEDPNNIIDCCFTDINMPGMGGLELAEYLRKTDNTIPVVIMTGYPSLDNAISTMKNGVVDFLIKPVNLSQLTLCLQRVLRERDLFIRNIMLHKELKGKKRLEHLNRELMVKVDELRVLNKIMSELMSVRSGSEIFHHIVNMALSVTPADFAAFYIVSESMDMPFLLTSRFKSDDQPVAPFLTDKRNKNGLDELIRKIVKDEMPFLFAENSGRRMIPEMRSLVGIPLKIRDKIFGVQIVLTYAGGGELTERDIYYLSFMSRQAAYLIENIALYENIYDNLFSTLSAFVTTVEARDAYTKAHSNRVTDTAMMIAETMGCSKEELDVLNFAGRLHDIGKIGIRDDILLKPERLSADEYEKIKEHPIIGESIVGQLGLWDREKKIIRHHHEWYDGSGYPDGLKKSMIPLLSRILSVADAYDAMMSDRAYRKEMSPAEVLKIIESGKGTQFDPDIVSIFMDMYRSGRFEPVYGAFPL